MFEDQTYNVSNVVVKAKEREGDRATMLDLTRKALTDLTELIMDPTTQSVTLTAAVLGSDDTIAIENIILNHGKDTFSPTTSVFSRHTVSWKHTVPRAVEELFSELANNLTLYITAEDGPIDSVAITGIAIGDPSLETLLKSQSQKMLDSINNIGVFDDEDIDYD